MKKLFLKQVSALFLMLGFVFIPLNFDGKGFQYQLTDFIFSHFVSFLQQLFFENALANVDFSSDTIALNLLLLVLLAISIIVIFLLRIAKVDISRWIAFCRFVAIYYLFFILLKYGFDKVFVAQFPTPEPNILFTDFGNLSKDILYWSTLGTSHLYSILTGFAEVLAAFLIVFKRTRIFGLVVAFGIFLNVIFINIGFDISVKTFSCFLLLTIIFALWPSLKSLVDFFFREKPSKLESQDFFLFRKPYLNLPFQLFLSGILVIQVLYPYAVSENRNGDNAQQSGLFGAFEVKQIVIGDQILTNEQLQIKRIFFHKSNYLILQNPGGKTTDYHFLESKNQLILEDYHQNKIAVGYNYQPKDSILQLHFKSKQGWYLVAKKLNISKLPALKDDFHLTIDGIR